MSGLIGGPIRSTRDVDLVLRLLFSSQHVVERTQSWSVIHKIFNRTRASYFSIQKGSLLFCPTCGTLLSLPKDGDFVITCEQCAHEEPASCKVWFLN